jgi:hypothetical protein
MLEIYFEITQQQMNIRITAIVISFNNLGLAFIGAKDKKKNRTSF